MSHRRRAPSRSPSATAPPGRWPPPHETPPGPHLRTFVPAGECAMRRRRPRRLAGALAETMSRAAPATPLAAVQAVWERAAGAEVAAQARPVEERDGVVTVACRSATWAQELDLLA